MYRNSQSLDKGVSPEAYRMDQFLDTTSNNPASSLNMNIFVIWENCIEIDQKFYRFLKAPQKYTFKKCQISH